LGRQRIKTRENPTCSIKNHVNNTNVSYLAKNSSVFRAFKLGISPKSTKRSQEYYNQRYPHELGFTSLPKEFFLYMCEVREINQQYHKELTDIV
jgi:hypothetical protein